MSFRGLIVLVVLLAAAVGLIVYLDHRKTPAPAEPAAAALVGTFEQQQVRRIEAACGPHSWTIVRGDGGGWRMTAPVDAEADPRRIGDMLAAIQEARARKTVADAGAGAAGFGLAPAACQIRLMLAGEAGTRVLSLGRTSPVGIDRYALDVGGRVVLADGTIYGMVDREPDALREKRLLPFEAETATRIVLDAPSGRLVLESSADGWRLAQPVSDAAAPASCLRLATALASLEVSGASPPMSPAQVPPDRRIAIEVTVRGGKAPLKAFVATAGVNDQRLAWRDGGGLAGLIKESSARAIETGVDAYRDKRVATFSSPDARRIAVTRGGRTIRAERSAEGAVWSGHDGESTFTPDAARIEEVLDRLHRLSAVDVVRPAAATLSTGTVEVSGTSGVLASIAWGPLPPEPGASGESLWVTTPSRPGVVFKVAATDLGPMPSSAADWSPAPHAAKP